MTTTASEITVQNPAAVHDVEALVQAAVSVLTNDMQIATHEQVPVVQGQEHGAVQLLVDTCNSNNIQERLFMCTDCNLAFYGEQGEQEWQWHLKQHKQYKCDLCAEAYEDKESLKQHVRSHSIQMPFVCDKCGSAYSLKSNLTQHMKTHEDKLYQCGECSVMFRSQSNLEKHLKLHTGTINLFQCEQCNKTFSQQKNLVQHMKIHQGNVGKQFKCPECPAAYSYKCHLSRHLIIHTGEKPYKCKFCGKAFNRNAHLIRHRKMHSGGEKEWKCSMCNFAFWEKGDLVRHMKSHEGNRPLKCDYCDQTFVWKRYLYKHLNNHHRDVDKHFCKTCLACLPSEEELAQHDMSEHANRKPLTHTCEVCKMEFHFKYKLDEHMFVHTGQKAHACQKCPQKFVSRKDLDRHLMDHQQEVSFRCNTCEKTFSNVDELQRHVKLHTGYARYSCSLCSASYRWKSQLTSHMVIHSSDRDFKCTFCKRRLKRKRDLIRHIKIYHDTKPPYTCTECNKDFHSPYYLMTHKNETHWKDTDREEGHFPCKHCTGVFGIQSDLQRHLDKVHPPRPNHCLLCMKKFTLFKFLEKHFEVKHEGVEMIEGTNYEIKQVEKEIAQPADIEKENNNEEADIGGLEMDVETFENNVDDGEENINEDKSLEELANRGDDDQSMLTISDLNQQVMDSESYATQPEHATSITELTNVPIPEAITLAQFSQQGSVDEVVPVFLHENANNLQQQPSVVQEVVGMTDGASLGPDYKDIVKVIQPQVVSISHAQGMSLPTAQSVTIQQMPASQVQNVSQPIIHTISQAQIQGAQVVTIPKPQVVSLPKPQVLALHQLKPASLSQAQVAPVSLLKTSPMSQPRVVHMHRVSSADGTDQNKFVISTGQTKNLSSSSVKIPIINKSQSTGGHIVVQQGKGPAKQIKIVSLDLNQMNAQQVHSQLDSFPTVAVSSILDQTSAAQHPVTSEIMPDKQHDTLNNTNNPTDS